MFNRSKSLCGGTSRLSFRNEQIGVRSVAELHVEDIPALAAGGL